MVSTARVCFGPDLLDQMNPDDPKAKASRRDIKRINAVMFQDAIMRGAIARCRLHPAKRILDLGGGDGTLTLKVVKHIKPEWRGAELVIVDRVDVVEPRTRTEFEQLGWTLKVVTSDVVSHLEQLERKSFDLVLSNLFIHHFPADRLATLLGLISEATKAFIACEPRRTSLTLAGGAMLWAIGCSPVTVRDSVTGARAGFVQQEISHLWPDGDAWALTEYEKGLFSHCFIAQEAHQS